MQTTQSKLNELKNRLHQVRRASLVATSRGDYRAVARLTVEAAEINKNILNLAGPIWGE